MATLLRTYATPAAAHVAVERMLAAGVTGAEIGLLEPGNHHDHRDDPVRNYAGRAVHRVGAFAGPPHSPREGAGTFAGDPRVSAAADLTMSTARRSRRSPAASRACTSCRTAKLASSSRARDWTRWTRTSCCAGTRSWS